jgi:uncharacterized membrane protein YccC
LRVKLSPNIDECGKRHRIRGGVAVLALGVVVLVVWAFPSSHVLPWALGLAGVATGAFMIFEGRNAWCVLRALGFKTRI